LSEVDRAIRDLGEFRFGWCAAPEDEEALVDWAGGGGGAAVVVNDGFELHEVILTPPPLPPPLPPLPSPQLFGWNEDDDAAGPASNAAADAGAIAIEIEGLEALLPGSFQSS
jgi:hypothetical protein